MESRYRVLCCDGGGILGLITATLIQRLNEKTDFLSTVNLFAGTSTGGIIATALATGVPIEEVVSIYDNECNCRSIFKPYKKFSIFGDLFHVKHTDTGLKEVLRDVLGKPRNLNDLSKDVFVTTFQLDNTNLNRWLPIYLTNMLEMNQPLTNVEAAMCTSAAPTYFPPHFLKGFGYCVDGGVFANNPSTIALSTILKTKRASLENIDFLSVGVGFINNKMTGEEVGNPYKCGIKFWGLGPNKNNRMPIFSMMFDGACSEINTEQNESFLGENYLRLNPNLGKKIEMDDCSSISKLKDIVDDFTVDSNPDWADAISWVSKHFIR